MKTKKELKEKLTAAEPADFIGEERGQISVLLLLGLIPLIFLVALIVNTANQTTKKIQLQGAADAGVLSGAIWEARGMNLIALNNNSMAEILSVMIVVRSLERTAALMPLVTSPLHVPPLTPIALDSDKGSAQFYPIISSVDNRLNARDAFGWKALHVLDKFNQIIRDLIPPIALFENYNYAKENGASLSILSTAKSFSISNFTELANEKTKVQGISKTISGFRSLLTPLLPVARSKPQFLAIRASECQLRLLSPLRIIGSLVLPIFYWLSLPIALILYNFFVEINLAELSGYDNRGIFERVVNLIRKAVRKAINFLGDFPLIGDLIKRVLNRVVRGAVSLLKIFLRPLQWNNSSNPPMPMLLSETPESGRRPSTKKEEEVDLKKVRKYLQYLALTFDERDEKSPIGGTRFLNESALFLPNTQLAYAQAEVYNPTKWSMFSQDWRAKLAKATVFDEKFTDWSFVNNH